MSRKPTGFVGGLDLAPWTVFVRKQPGLTPIGALCQGCSSWRVGTMTDATRWRVRLPATRIVKGEAAGVFVIEIDPGDGFRSGNGC